MKAAVIPEPHRVEIREIDRPSPGPGQALIEVEAVGVCGSDLHAYEGTQPFFQYPEVGGHEVVGTVVEVREYEGEPPAIPGRRQPRPPAEGDRVVLDPSMPCAGCYPCRTGRYNCCENMRVLGVHAPGAFAEYLLAPLGCLHENTPEISADAAVMVEPLSIGVQSSTRARVGVEDTVLVIGAGTIGLSVLQVCLSRSARVAVSDLSEGRLEIARSMGATAAVNPADGDLREALAEPFSESGPSVAIEAVGTPATVRQALDVVAASGRVVMLGLCTEEICIEGALMVRKELDFLGSRLHGGTVPQAVALVEEGEVHPEKLVTHHMRLDDLEHAFELMIDQPDTTLKVILDTVTDQPIPVLVIGGPTAAGKTEISLQVAERVGGEIVSADSMQIYERMDIGTGKPTPQERARAPIHLVDFVPPDGEYTVAQFTQEAERLIEQIHGRGRLPIVAGGTGLYLRALTEGFDFPPPPEDETTREALWAQVDEVGSEAMHGRLAEVDPASSERIAPADARRIVRALEVYEVTGRPMSEERSVDGEAASHYNCAKYVLSPPRKLLFSRIERRVDAMVEAGWADEVRALVEAGVPSDAQSMQAIGYRHLREHLDGERDLEETVALIKRGTRRFARRQLTWLRRGEAYQWLAPADERQRRACVAMMVTRANRMWG